MLRSLRFASCLSLIGILCLGALAHADIAGAIQCVGTVSSLDGHTTMTIELRLDNDTSDQTMISGNADGVYALMLFFKSDQSVEISVSDTTTHVTAGSHGGFDGNGAFETGFTLVSAPDVQRHVKFHCEKPAAELLPR
jgi:hypothetical protein